MQTTPASIWAALLRTNAAASIKTVAVIGRRSRVFIDHWCVVRQRPGPRILKKQHPEWRICSPLGRRIIACLSQSESRLIPRLAAAHVLFPSQRFSTASMWRRSASSMVRYLGRRATWGKIGHVQCWRQAGTTRLDAYTSADVDSMGNLRSQIQCGLCEVRTT